MSDGPQAAVVVVDQAQAQGQPVGQAVAGRGLQLGEEVLDAGRAGGKKPPDQERRRDEAVHGKIKPAQAVDILKKTYEVGVFILLCTRLLGFRFVVLRRLLHSGIWKKILKEGKKTQKITHV